MAGHRHKDSRAKWTTTDAEPEVAHPADVLTQAEVTFLKVLLVAHGPGGTTPLPPNPPPAGDVTAPTVSGVSASVTTTTATIVATTDEAATVQVEYNTTGVWPGTLTAATSSGTSHSRTLTGLTPGQTYVYRVRATDTAGNLRLDTNRTFTTTSAPTLPGAPTGLTATGGNTQVVLNWTAPSNNGGSAITGYRVFRNGASLIVLGNVLTYTNTGLTNGLTYSYTVAAITAVGEGPQGNTASATPAAAGDVNPPVISNVGITGITTTSATVTWTTNEAATGVVRYGVTTTYGDQTSPTSSGTSHSRNLTGLSPSTTYHVQIVATDTAGNVRQDSDRTFTTQAVTPPPPPPTGTVYGPGISGDSRYNHRVGAPASARLSYRFRATTTSNATTFRVQQRGGGGYSGGNGGSIRASIQTDTNGRPSGTILGSVTFSPGNPSGDWEDWPLRTFSSPIPLTSGTLYHLMFENLDGSQTANYISLNCLWTMGNLPTPRQPRFSDDFGVMYEQSGTWAPLLGDLPIFDLTYANGTHDGQSYIGAATKSIGVIEGSTHVRQTMTVSGGDRTVAAMYVRLKRISGSSPLDFTLEGPAGVIETVSIPAASIPVGPEPNATGNAEGNTWIKAQFTTPRTLTNGQLYKLRLSSASRYTTTPIQEGTPKGLTSYCFLDGQAETNASGSWQPIYNPVTGPVDLQFYLR